MNDLVKVTYNLDVEIKTHLDQIPLIAIVDDETLTLARNERAKLNKVIDSFETERKKLNKAINDNFKTALADAVARLATFDENIKVGVEEQKERRLAEIKAFITEQTKIVNVDNAPLDEFLKDYNGYKTKVKLWVSKVTTEIEMLNNLFGQDAVTDFHTHYNSTLTLDRFTPKEAPKEAPKEMPTAHIDLHMHVRMSITVKSEKLDEIIALLKENGVVINEIYR